MSKFAQAICVFALAFGLQGGLQAQTNHAVDVIRTTGIVGIAEGQTAQFNALNPGVAPPSATGALCTGVLSFIAGDGTVLKTKTVNVAPGTSQPLMLDSVADLALAVNARKEIRATIAIAAMPTPTASTATPVQPVCKLIGTLEIYNTLDGHTQVALGAVHEVPIPAVTPGT